MKEMVAYDKERMPERGYDMVKKIIDFEYFSESICKNEARPVYVIRVWA